MRIHSLNIHSCVVSVCQGSSSFKKDGNLNSNSFRELFIQKFKTPQLRMRSLAQLDSYDKFQQKGTMTDHRFRLHRLCMQLEHLGVVQTNSLTASKYLRPLRPDLRNPVELKYTVLHETLEGVHAITNCISRPLPP
jgi:hypothetical protein